MPQIYGGKNPNSFAVAYAYPHAIDSESSTFGDSYLLSRVGQGLLGFQGAFNPSVDKGKADFDMRHRFVAGFNWGVPFARGLGVRRLELLLDGWATNGVMNFRTGVPSNVFDTGQPDNDGLVSIRQRVMGLFAQPLDSQRPASGVNGTFDFLDLAGPAHTPSVNGPFTCTSGATCFTEISDWLYFLRREEETLDRQIGPR
jgi:hypothetical protein